jgi:hypothetical protein
MRGCIPRPKRTSERALKENGVNLHLVAVKPKTADAPTKEANKMHARTKRRDDVRTHRCRVSTCTTKGINRLTYLLFFEKQKSSRLHLYADYEHSTSRTCTHRGIIKMCTPKAGGCVWSLCASLSTTISEAVGQPRRAERDLPGIYTWRRVSTPQQTHQQSQEPAAATSKQQPTNKPSA